MHKITCSCCNTTHPIHLDEPVYNEWQNGGVSLSKIAPYIPKNEVTLLITGICDQCWDAIKNGEEIHQPTPEPPQQKQECLNCGEIFTTDDLYDAFCSENCRADHFHWYDERDT